jgi:anti-anti-sigma regulatory factor
MHADIGKLDGDWTLRVTGIVEIDSIGDLHRVAREAAAAPGLLVLELGAVERLDVAGLQVLLALARRRERGVRVGRVSDAVTETCRRLGLDGALG